MNLPDFRDKVITANIKDDDLDHEMIDPHFEEQGNRLFIIGRIPRETGTSGGMAEAGGHPVTGKPWWADRDGTMTERPISGTMPVFCRSSPI